MRIPQCATTRNVSHGRGFPPDRVAGRRTAPLLSADPVRGAPASLPAASSSPTGVPWLQTTSRLLPRPPRGGCLISASIYGFEMGVPRIESCEGADINSPPCARREPHAGWMLLGPVQSGGREPLRRWEARQMDAAGRAAGLLLPARSAVPHTLMRLRYCFPGGGATRSAPATHGDLGGSSGCCGRFSSWFTGLLLLPLRPSRR